MYTYLILYIIIIDEMYYFRLFMIHLLMINLYSHLKYCYTD